MLYRLRKLGHLLDHHHELETQQIYFAKPSELNDPMEAIRDMIWSGDRIVWTNLFKHYILCLQWMLRTDLSHGSNFRIGPESLPVLGLPSRFSDDFWERYYRPSTEAIIKQCELNVLIELLHQTRRQVHRAELSLYLHNIHFTAYAMIRNFHADQGMEIRSKRSDVDKIDSARLDWKEFFMKWEREADPAGYDRAMASMIAADQLQRVVRRLGSKSDLKGLARENENFLIMQFIDAYLDGLNTIAWPDWYVASFTGNPWDSAQWAHYADNHQGVCLAFDDRLIDGLSHGFERNHGIAAQPSETNGYTALCVRDVNYLKTVGYVNFFNAIGHMNRNRVYQTWYSNENNELSTCAPAFKSKDEKNDWMTDYVDQFLSNVAMKTNDWEYEQEKRIILTSRDVDLRDKGISVTSILMAAFEGDNFRNEYALA